MRETMKQQAKRLVDEVMGPKSTVRRKGMIRLGDKVKDKITGFTGVVTGITTWLNGCVRMGIQGIPLKNGLPLGTEWIDEAQLKLIKAGVVKVVAEGPAGPRRDAQRMKDPTR